MCTWTLHDGSETSTTPPVAAATRGAARTAIAAVRTAAWRKRWTARLLKRLI